MCFPARIPPPILFSGNHVALGNTESHITALIWEWGNPPDSSPLSPFQPPATGWGSLFSTISPQPSIRSQHRLNATKRPIVRAARLWAQQVGITVVRRPPPRKRLVSSKIGCIYCCTLPHPVGGQVYSQGPFDDRLQNKLCATRSHIPGPGTAPAPTTQSCGRASPGTPGAPATTLAPGTAWASGSRPAGGGLCIFRKHVFGLLNHSIPNSDFC